MFLYTPTSLSLIGNISSFIIEQMIIEQDKNMLNMFCFSVFLISRQILHFCFQESKYNQPINDV